MFILLEMSVASSRQKCLLAFYYLCVNKRKVIGVQQCLGPMSSIIKSNTFPAYNRKQEISEQLHAHFQA